METVLYGDLTNISALFYITAALLMILLSTTCGIVAFINLGTRTLPKTLIPYLIDMVVFLAVYDACAATVGNGEVRGKLGELFASSGPYLRVMVLTAVTTYAVIRLMYYLQKTKKEIVTYSVSKAMDALPQGIVFATEDGQILQSNRTMEDLGYRAMGETMMDARDFWDSLKEGKAGEGIRVEEADEHTLVVTFPEGDTWIISNSVRECEITPFRQVIAVDGTREMQAARELDVETKRLANMNKRLRHYNNVVDRVIREEELLETKKRVHDQMGSTLLAAKALIGNEEGVLSPDDVLFQWEEDMILMRNDEPVKEGKSQLDRLKDAADFLGIDLQLMGEIPENYQVMSLICTGIQECMTNAVQHAEASQMYVVITRDDDEYKVNYSNNGKPMEGELKEGSGLSLLRKSAEKMNATMEYGEGRFFDLTLHIPRPDSDY